MSSRRPALFACFLLVTSCSSANSAPGTNTASAPSSVSAPATPNKPPRPAGDPQPKLALGVVEFEAPAPRAPLTLKVEVADDDEERQKGLMFREQLAEDEGMLFIFPSERRNSFWMHNTLIPLDMFFIDSSWNVVGVVEGAEPLTDSPRQVARMSQYVLEVPGGFAKRHGYGAGQKLRFIPPAQ